MFGFRVVEEELEARLEPVSGQPLGSGANGKIERKRYRGGVQRLKFRCRGLHLSDGATVTLSIGGRAVAEFTVSGGRVRFEVEDAAPGAVPQAAAGEVAEVCVDGKAIVRGDFHHD